MECVASHLKQKELRKYGGCLKSSSPRILLQSLPGQLFIYLLPRALFLVKFILIAMEYITSSQGMELYGERLVSALAREMQVPLLKVDLGDDFVEEKDNEVSSTFTKGNTIFHFYSITKILLTNIKCFSHWN